MTRTHPTLRLLHPQPLVQGLDTSNFRLCLLFQESRNRNGSSEAGMEPPPLAAWGMGERGNGNAGQCRPSLMDGRLPSVTGAGVSLRGHRSLRCDRVGGVGSPAAARDPPLSPCAPQPRSP